MFQGAAAKTGPADVMRCDAMGGKTEREREREKKRERQGEKEREREERRESHERF